jgi:hypothetical protein
VHNGERWALFNMHGKRITKFEYKEVEGYKNGDIDWYRFRDNRIWVTTESTPFFIDFQGNPFFWGNVSGLEPFELQHSIATLMNGNQVLIDTNGTAVSDTFLSLQRIPSSPYFLAQTLNKYHLKLTLLPSGRLQKSAWSSDKAIAWAWYWGKPVFQLEQHKESLFIDANDSLLLKGKFSDVYIFAQTIFIQQSRKNPKQKQSALVKKWFNPYLQSFSLVQADDIGILTQERIAVTQQKTAFLYHIDETPFPIFDANTSLAEVNSIRQITQLNRTNQFMVSTDTSQAIVNLEGRLLLPFYTAQIEEFGSQWYLLTDSIGARIVNDKNQVVLGPFEEINEEGFPGYFLIKQGETWIWIDSKKRLFSESV